ncbi:Cytochrom_B561 domain-containing protein/DOMON domain-containing protein/DM13 domain-containing protein [Cephalotus follicularis]|uniref:Cytochrom_B561 domain-containing protein/DOMON domain-containing protein/DM13 domain-containing protein n=1 Tax=Cephalotus follicularis TaxID=3775 RepID=A0A1Q3AW94_CEPFO|nr:Cytochrom_B561 domain-containing protein/DOMON domain-containing protein/DM13 domain-containing protein [Cephalotus follicularis]
MNPHHTKPLILGFLLNSLFLFCYADPGQNCSKTTQLVGFESEFLMVQHQLRGLITIIDDCSFRVSQFDMLSGSYVRFWGAIAPDFANLTGGFIISDHSLNQTFKNASFTVHLTKNVTWDMFQVISIWDLPTASDFGHVLINGSYSDPSPGLAPAPSANGSDSDSGVDKTPRLTVPTMFDNCKVLSKDYRIRWSLNVDDDLINIGLEAITGIQNYMAFGWANPNSNSGLMIGADVVVTGFTEEGMPFADDYFITKYSECLVSKDGSASGVCPDILYEGSDPNTVGLVNNTILVYGHRKDGVSLIRYRKRLKSVDNKYDLPVDYTTNMTVIWALGLIKPPDALRPYYLPQNHGGPRSVSYGSLVLNVSEHVNDCLGPLDAEDKEDQDLIIADGKVPLVVTTANAMHYPNPPNPSKVLYINKKEAPVLRVERGVPVKFSIQAGHDVALYVTSDFLGGNATLRNMSETIYAGGQEAQGVLSSPMELIWAPDRNTPDQVYYQSLYQQKMGWKVQVVDGGLSDMYDNSVVLDDQQVTFFWTLSEDSISIAARGEKKSGYLAIGFGSGMVNTYAYVGWLDNSGKGHVNTYWIDGKDASNLHLTNENLTYVRCKSENGIITLEFTRPLNPSCGHRENLECKNIIDSTTPLKVIWAMGARWTDEHLTERNMHYITSQRPVRVLLMRGSAEAEQDLRPVLAVHGFMMFLAWGILIPGGILSARYLKHVKGDGWYQIHVYLQYSGLAIVMLGLLFAVAEIRGFSASSVHVKFGITAIFLACVQPVNALLRPKKPANGEQISSKRLLWEYFHVIVGRCAIVAGIAALFSGMKHLGDRYGGENVHGLSLALIVWFLLGALMVLYLEYREKQRRRERIYGRSNWVLGNLEEDDSVDLLSPNGAFAPKGSQPSERMEVQLEPLSR